MFLRFPHPWLLGHLSGSATLCLSAPGSGAPRVQDQKCGEWDLQPSPGGGRRGPGPGAAAPRAAPAGRSAGRMPAGAGSVRGHVTAAIRALRADASLPPRLLAGRARSRRPGSPSHRLAAAAAARGTMTGTRRRRRPRSLRLLCPPSAPGSSRQDGDRRKVAGWLQPGVPLPASAAAPPPPGAATRAHSDGAARRSLCRPPEPSFLLPSPCPSSCSHREGQAGGAAAAGLSGGGAPVPRGRRTRPPGRGGVWGAAPASRRRGRGRLRPGSTPACAGAGHLGEPIFRPVGPGCRKLEPGERSTGADPVRWEGAGPLVATIRVSRRLCPSTADCAGPSRW